MKRETGVNTGSKAPLFVRPLTDEERARIQDCLRSPDAFTLRRAQTLLARARAEPPKAIAAALGCSVQTVRNTIHAFHDEGTSCLARKSNRPKTAAPIFEGARAERLRGLLHQSPRAFGKGTSLWTLALAAQVCHEQGLTEQTVSGETVRRALGRLGMGWKRAKHWISSPDPAYTRKKRRDRLITLCARHPDWAVGFQDEVWFSRLAQPTARAWQGPPAAEPGPVRLVGRPPDKDDPEPKAFSCYGLLRHDGAAAGRMHLRFVDGRPVSSVTTQFLGWLAQEMASEGKRALMLFWDNASWHLSKEVRAWVRAHNRRVKQEGGCRLLVCALPSKSPWLNNIEPKWVHGKRAILEPDRKLTVSETRERICDYYGCERLEPLAQQLA